MKCPHCLKHFHDEKKNSINLDSDADGLWHLYQSQCPACKRFVFSFWLQGGSKGNKIFVTYPKGCSRTPCPAEVDSAGIAEDYREACLVLADSPKASAALSRRCLQHILREKAAVKAGDL